ncbi:uncharacterized protein Jabba isoform X2 [Panulirus ornatus]|uniref:uncharacterized protein Jabba isoform X2 n=1 Tax=Panulirus ornatus TaxID=150431 RepID=UPI003A898C0C
MADEPILPTTIPQSPPLRTLLEEVATLPIVASAAGKVGATHGLLCRVVPLYGRLTAAAVATTCTITRRAEEYKVVRTSVKKVEELGLKAVDSLRSSYPIINKPTHEVLEKLSVLVYQRVQLGSSRVASLHFSQITCRAAEAVMVTAERACATSLPEDGVVARVLPKPLKRVYSSSFLPLLISAGRCLRNWRRALRAWRHSGMRVSVAKEHTKRLRKVRAAASLTRKTAKGEWHRWWVRLPGWSWLGADTSLRLSSTMHVEVREALPHSPHKNIPSEKKGKRSKADQPEMTCRDLLRDLDDYHSEDDSEYLPSETSTDSLEYRSTDCEVSEAPITDEDFSEQQIKVVVNGAEDAVDGEVAEAPIPPGDHHCDRKPGTRHSVTGELH